MKISFKEKFSGGKRLRTGIEAFICLSAIGLGAYGFIHADATVQNILGGSSTTSLHSAGLLVRESGAVRYQSKGIVFWQDLLDKSQNLDGGDTVLTGMDGFANLEFKDGTSVRLTPDSLLVVKSEKPAPSANITDRMWSWAFTKPKVKLELKRGSIQVRVKGKEKAPEIAINNEVVNFHELDHDSVMEVNSKLEIATLPADTIPMPVVKFDQPKVPLTAAPAPALLEASVQDLEKKPVLIPSEAVASENIEPQAPAPIPSAAPLAPAAKPSAVVSKKENALPLALDLVFKRKRTPARAIASDLPAVAALESSPIAVPLPLTSTHEGERELASISHAIISDRAYSAEVSTGLNSFGFSQGGNTDAPLSFTSGDAKAFSGRLGYAPTDAFGGEVRIGTVNGRIQSREASQNQKYSASNMSAEITRSFTFVGRSSNGLGFETSVRAGAYRFSNPYIQNDGTDLFVRNDSFLAGGIGIGGKLRIGRSWVAEATFRTQRPLSNASASDTFRATTKLMLDGLISAAYVTESGIRLGLGVSQLYQSKNYELLQLDGSTENSKQVIKAFGANALVGVDF